MILPVINLRFHTLDISCTVYVVLLGVSLIYDCLSNSVCVCFIGEGTRVPGENYQLVTSH